jgi:hypothetical protein
MAPSWVSRTNHPVLQQQQVMQGGQVVEPNGFFSEFAEAVDSTPSVVAGFVLGAAAALFMLKAMGFRFNFGVGAKVGK